MPPKFRDIVSKLRDVFKVTTVKKLDGGVLEVILQPTENVGSVVDFIEKTIDEKRTQGSAV